MDGFELQVELNDAIKLGFEAVNQWEAEQRDSAVAEDAYRRAKSTAFAKARADGLPATLTPALVAGWEEVAAPRLDWQMKEATAQAQHERVLLFKKQIDVLRDAVAREWSRSKA